MDREIDMKTRASDLGAMLAHENPTLRVFTLDSLTTFVTTANLEPSPHARARQLKIKGRGMKYDDDDDNPMARAHRASLAGNDAPSLSEQHRDLMREIRSGKLAAHSIAEIEAQVAPIAATVLRGIAEERARTAQRGAVGETALAAKRVRAAALVVAPRRASRSSSVSGTVPASAPSSGAATPPAIDGGSGAATPFGAGCTRDYMQREGDGDGDNSASGGALAGRESMDCAEALEAEKKGAAATREAEAEANATAEIIRSLTLELVASEGVEKAWIDRSRETESERENVEKMGGRLPWLTHGDAAIDVNRQIESYQLERSGGPRPLRLKMQYPSPLVHQATKSGGRLAALRAASLGADNHDDADVDALGRRPPGGDAARSFSARNLKIAAESAAVHSVPHWVHARNDIGVFPHHASGPFHERRAAKLDARARMTRDDALRTTLLAQAALEHQTARRQTAIMEKEKRMSKFGY